MVVVVAAFLPILQALFVSVAFESTALVIGSIVLSAVLFLVGLFTQIGFKTSKWNEENLMYGLLVGTCMSFAPITVFIIYNGIVTYVKYAFERRREDKTK